MKNSGIKDKIFSIVYNKLDFVTFTKIWTIYQAFLGKDKRTYHQAYVVSKRRSKKRYFIVRMTCPIMGAGAVMRNFILIASWAEKNGWIPVLDWEYEGTFNEGKIGIDNFQDVLFENKVSMKDIINDSYSIVGTINKVDVFDDSNSFIRMNLESCYCRPTESFFDEYYDTFRMYINKYFTFNPQIINECKEQYKDVLENSESVLALMIREEFSAKGKEMYKGTDYEEVLERHPSSITVEEAIELVHKKMNEWGCRYVFVASIMKETEEIFRKEFENKVFFVERERLTWESSKEVITRKEQYSENAKEYFPREKMIEQSTAYVKEIFIASQCGHLIGSPSTGVTLALSLNAGKYVNKYIAGDYSGIVKEVAN